MSETVGQGKSITLDAFYRDDTDALVDPGSPTITVIDALGVTVIDALTPSRISLGHYAYDYTTDVAAPLGGWVARWEGILDGNPIAIDVAFSVTAIEDAFEAPDAITEIRTPRIPGALVTLEALAETMRLPVGTIDTAAATQAILGAGHLIRNELGQALDFIADDIVTLKSPGGRYLLLPEVPVVSVASVRIRTAGRGYIALVEGTDYELELGREGAIWRIDSVLDFGGSLWLQSPTLIGEWPRSLSGRGPNGWVEVIYSHGYAIGDEFGSGLPAGIEALPPIVSTVASRVAARGYVNPEAVTQETTGRFTNVVYSTPGLYLSQADKDDLDSLRPGSRGGSR